MHENGSGNLLYISLGTPGEAVDLLVIEQLAEAVRSVFRELLKESAEDNKVQVRLVVRDATKGSLNLVLEPQILGTEVVDASTVSASLINDINGLSNDAPRSTIGSGLLSHYRSLVGIGQRAGRLELRTDSLRAVVDTETLVTFQAALREVPEPDTVVVGRIESVNIHRRPWTFGLYTKFDQERVECRFDEAMLDHVLHLMETKATVQAIGEGRFGPVGTTPRQLDLHEAPQELVFFPDLLRSFRRSSDITRQGESSADAVLRVREERASYG
jgi:hypothetical protein